MKISAISSNLFVKTNNKNNVSTPIQNNLPSLKEDKISFGAWTKDFEEYLKSQNKSIHYSFPRSRQNNSLVNQIRKDLNIIIPNQKLEVDDAQRIFEYFDIETEKTEDNKLIISKYEQKYNKFADYYACGIDENELLKHVVEIKGDADFTRPEITSLGSVKKIGGDADFRNSKITTLGKLESIGGDALLYDSEITDLGNLRFIYGDVDFAGPGYSDRYPFYHTPAKIKNTGKLQYIKGVAYCSSRKLAKKLKPVAQDGIYIIRNGFLL